MKKGIRLFFLLLILLFWACEKENKYDFKTKSELDSLKNELQEKIAERKKLEKEIDSMKTNNDSLKNEIQLNSVEN